MTLVPSPRKMRVHRGELDLRGMQIVMNTACDARIFKACKTLADELESLTGAFSKINKAFDPASCGVCVSVCAGTKKNCESYTLTVDANGVKIASQSLAGAFYGIQTLRQLAENGGGKVPYCEIKDEPDMKLRGYYLDVSRGRVPTVEGVKKIIDMLAYYKVNMLQVYIEHAFDFKEYRCFLDPDGYMTAEEIMELDDYCYDNFIDFVPSLSTFGHLYRLLSSKRYAHLCELEDYKPDPNPWVNRMLHHTIDASNPESFELIKSLIDQFIPLFRSSYFNICCDETFDLCRGRNAGKDKAKLYLEFTTKLIDHVSSRGKTAMMWGDIVLNHPEIIPSFPKDMVMLCWDYRDVPNVGAIDKFASAGVRQMVCPGCSSWNHFSEAMGYARKNIVAMADGGMKNGALGILNTSWGDYGHVCSANCSLYGLVLGAVKGWRCDTDVFGKEYNKAVSSLVYGDPTGRAVELIEKLGATESVMNWGIFTQWHFGVHSYYGKALELGEKDAAEFIENANVCLGISKEFASLGTGEIYEDLVLAAEADYYLSMGFARMLGAKAEVCESAFLDWSERYAASWLRENKVSDLYLIPDLMKKVLFE